MHIFCFTYTFKSGSFFSASPDIKLEDLTSHVMAVSGKLPCSVEPADPPPEEEQAGGCN